jgi:polar amino acid transport system substrate-binding protein
MSTRLIIQRVLVTLAAALPLLATSLAQADTIRVRADRWYPYNGDPGSERPGYVIEMLQRVLGAAGHQIDYQVVPWQRALHQTGKGKADCVVGAYPEEAPHLLFSKVPVGMDTDVFISAADDTWVYEGVASLAGKRFGAVAGYSYDTSLDALIASKPDGMVMIAGHDGLLRGLRMIDSGRLDLFVESRTVFLANVYLAGTRQKYRIAGETEQESPMFVACTPGNPHAAAWLALLDDAIPAMRKNGELATLLRRYGLDDWESARR